MTVQDKNIAWYLPRPKPDHYKGGMPLYAEEWLLRLAGELLPKFVRVTKDDGPQILNVFCGMNKYGKRVDLNLDVKPDYWIDAHKMSSVVPNEAFDIILADPPHSEKEKDELYSPEYPKLNYKKWTAECDKCLKPGGILIIYHKLVPANPNPDKYVVVKRVAIFNRVWHLPRVAIFFQKKVSP